jgi:hypothetical protein
MMKVLSHAELVTLIRNTEGPIHVGIGDDEYCCNLDVVEADPVTAELADLEIDDTAIEPPVEAPPIDPPVDSGEGQGDEATSPSSR